MPTKKLAYGERRSLNEKQFEAELNKRFIEYKYEPKTFTIIPPREGTFGLTSAVTYTPDFHIMYKGTPIWIEVKGYARAEDLLKLKIADAWFKHNNQLFVVVSQFGTQKSGTKGWYRYTKKGAVARAKSNILSGQSKSFNTDNLWTELDKLIEKEKTNE